MTEPERLEEKISDDLMIEAQRAWERANTCDDENDRNDDRMLCDDRLRAALLVAVKATRAECAGIVRDVAHAANRKGNLELCIILDAVAKKIESGGGAYGVHSGIV